MARLLALLSFLLFASAASADCARELSAPGGVSSFPLPSDLRALESLLGKPVDDAICATMRPVRRFGRGFLPRIGFFVLTADEVLFVSERKKLEVQFRAAFADVRGLAWNVYRFSGGWMPAPTFDIPLEVTLVTDAERLSVITPCTASAGRFVSELEDRTAANPGIRMSRPPGTMAGDACRPTRLTQPATPGSVRGASSS